ncbi:leucine carboxyl methyltransferase 1 [Trichodelitschia bisporula]|uniref:Leucine carboxyl methyltransferase 1 n=1 Tax=Trichodelitschia bisporula TaxID=703511 RepID=A0A6G1IAE9_9PEZI|nr:leucine carboxyl methyltransferase 1 [Trichodelitschia bisporula]
MSTPRGSDIPNLNTFRSSHPGRGRGRKGGFAASEQGTEAQDQVVQRTDQDASVSRMNAVALGYLDDQFAKFFTPGPVPKKYPIINRGTYVRTTAIDMLVRRFLMTHCSQKKQIISLGAGSDTRYFRLVAENPSLPLVYHELDFAANTASKISTLKRNPPLLKALQGHVKDADDIAFSSDGTRLASPTYNIHPVDLRALVQSSQTPQPLSLPNLSPDIPTLVLSECCLIYLSPSAADSVLSALTRSLVPSPTPLSLILYEPIRPFDAFGKVMVANLASRGIHMQTLEKYASLSAQTTRLQTAGFAGGQGAVDVDFAFEQWIDAKERERISRCEMLDELEEWRLLARHYCVAWGWRNGKQEYGDVFSRAWDDVKDQNED